MPRAALWLMLSAVVIVADQISKVWITETLHMGETVFVTSWFNLVLVHNPGAAFSFLSDASGWQRWFFTALALAVSAWLVLLIFRHARQPLLALALSLVLGGAIGNAIDRIKIGAVVDFVQWHWRGFYWPAFNVADSAITVGVVLLLAHELGVLRAGRHSSPPAAL